MTTGLLTGVVFLLFLIAGVLFGLLYECGYILRALTKFGKITTYVSDFILFLFAGVFFFFVALKVNNGIIALYEVFGFVLGFALERVSVGKMLAMILIFSYNIFTRFVKHLKKFKLFRFLLR